MHTELPASSGRRIGRNLLFLALFAGCVTLLIVLRTQGFLTPPGGSKKAPSDDQAAEEKAILLILANQEKAWNRGDLEAFMAGYWKSEDMSFYSGRDIQRGWQKTYDRYKARYQGEGKEMGKLAFSELQVERIAAGVAIVRGRWKLEMKSEKFDGLFTLIVKKLAEGWRIVHDHTSAGEAPAKKPSP